MEGTARRFTDELAEFASIREQEEPKAAKATGRRVLPPELQTHPFSLRFTPAERELVVFASRLVGSPAPATWARRALLALAQDALARAAAERPEER